MWPLIDPCYIVSAPVDCLLFLHFTFNSNLDEQFKLYPVNNGQDLLIDSKILHRDVSGKILNFNRKAKKLLHTMALFFEISAFAYCGLMVVLNGAYRVSFHSLFVLFVFMPFNAFYLTYGNSIYIRGSFSNHVMMGKG